MNNDYTPTETEMRDLYVWNSSLDMGEVRPSVSNDAISAEFDRFLARVKRDAWAEGHRDTLAYVASGNLNGDEWHAMPANPYEADGDPARPCGRGPCALGHEHAGDCAM